jgi:ribose 5-phosphate isomerase B
MKIGVGSDHKGFKLKEEAINYLQVWGFDVKDFGTISEEPCDYPKFAYLVSKAVASGKISRGILISENGIGMSIAANKVKGVRAARCVDWKDARSCREINAANVLCISEDADVSLIMEVWMAAEFDSEKHSQHVSQISEIESVE